MNEHMRLLLVRHKSIVRAALVTLGVLLIPLCGTLYVDDWNWGWRGFAVAGAFVFGAALAFELAIRGMSNKAYRFAMGLAVATALVLSWSNFVLAVDVSLANFMYFGVVVVGLVGAVIARLTGARNGARIDRDGDCSNSVPLIALVFLKTSAAPGPSLVATGCSWCSSRYRRCCFDARRGWMRCRRQRQYESAHADLQEQPSNTGRRPVSRSCHPGRLPSRGAARGGWRADPWSRCRRETLR